jgi:CheY-like chemotaxis protein
MLSWPPGCPGPRAPGRSDEQASAETRRHAAAGAESSRCRRGPPLHDLRSQAVQLQSRAQLLAAHDRLSLERPHRQAQVLAFPSPLRAETRAPSVKAGGDGGYNAGVKVLLVSPDPESRDLMRLAVGSIERRIGPLQFVEARDGDHGLQVAWRERPDVVVADEIASRAGAFALAKDLRGAQEPYPGVIVVLLERRHDAWLAKWSGADAWFVKPVDPFELADTVMELLTSKEPV